MDVLGAKCEATSEELLEALPASTDWRAGTVKAVLNRRLNKGAWRPNGKRPDSAIGPLLKRQDHVSEQSRALIDRLFDGRVGPLVAEFSELKAISKDDLEALRKQMQALDDDRWTPRAVCSRHRS